MPCLEDHLKVVLNHLTNPVQLSWREPMVAAQGQRLEPELTEHALSLHMDVLGLVAVEAIEEEPVLTRDTLDRRQAVSFQVKLVYRPDRLGASRPAGSELQTVRAGTGAVRAELQIIRSKLRTIQRAPANPTTGSQLQTVRTKLRRVPSENWTISNQEPGMARQGSSTPGRRCLAPPSRRLFE
jgi:hypothetical protein